MLFLLILFYKNYYFYRVDIEEFVEFRIFVGGVVKKKKIYDL